MRRLATAGVLLIGLTHVATLSGARPAPQRAAAIDELWQDRDIESLDLRWGSGGPEAAPSPDVEYEFKAADESGNSGGYEVADPQGRRWRVKTGIEAQPEMVASRVLWAMGYHQPTLYLMTRWKMKGGPVESAPAGRFRLSSDHTNAGSWSWTKNPFVGSRELRGLLVVNLVLNNWDMKDNQNRIYALHGQPGRWFVVQDLGAALGKSSLLGGRSNDIEGFESDKLVLGVENGRVKFDYHGYHAGLSAGITPADVVWACERLNRISDRQWADAFDSAAYRKDIADRFIAKIKSKIQEGLALGSRTTGNQ